jgi:glycosyltransferase involved in cell wall biosynthesis
MEVRQYNGRLGLQQRVLPAYRAPFFEMLSASCTQGLSVFAGKPLPKEAIVTADSLQAAKLVLARNRHWRDPSSAWFLCWQDGLLDWLEAWQPDALIVEANPRNLSTRLAVRWMHQHGRPVVGWGLGAPINTRRLAWLVRWQFRSFLNRLDGLIAYSEKGAAEYRNLRLSTAHIFVAHNAVAPRPSHPPPERVDAFAEKPVVLFVGRLQARKRIDLLLHACAALPQDCQPRLWIVGDGPDRQEMEIIARQVYPQAEFFGARTGADLEAFFIQADLFVLPGTGGLAAQQAMTYALPLIVARGDGTQNDLVRPENGWLIPTDDLAALTTALGEALSNPQRLRTLGGESYRIVSEEANLETMVDVFIHALNTVSRSQR